MGGGSHRGMRQRVAAEAARIIAELGILDFAGARRKAVARLRVTDRRQWPDNAEITEALERYRALFQSGDRERVLGRLRRAGLQAMDLLADFEPRLAGPVRDGTAGEHSPVLLYLFADSPKNVVIGLLDNGVYADAGERRMRFSGDHLPQSRPTLRFSVEDVDIEAVLLEPADRSRPPLDPASGRPDLGLAAAAVASLLEDQPRSDSGV